MKLILLLALMVGPLVVVETSGFLPRHAQIDRR